MERVSEFQGVLFGLVYQHPADIVRKLAELRVRPAEKCKCTGIDHEVIRQAMLALKPPQCGVHRRVKRAGLRDSQAALRPFDSFASDSPDHGVETVHIYVASGKARKAERVSLVLMDPPVCPITPWRRHRWIEPGHCDAANSWSFLKGVVCQPER